MSHIHEKYDFVISVFVIHDGKVLLVNHPRYGKWLPIGGHIELDEDPEMCLFREINEETGLDVEILSSKPQIDSPGSKFVLLPNSINVHEANAPHKHIALVYFARAKSGKFRLSNEHIDMKWFTPAELKLDTYGLAADIIYYAQEALKTARAWKQ